jgi:3-phenylpropionate/cinnamic acid dioxygenase small subunit
LTQDILTDAEQLLFLEADLLDRQQWDAWIGLYTSDCLFWVPSWDTE